MYHGAIALGFWGDEYPKLVPMVSISISTRTRTTKSSYRRVRTLSWMEPPFSKYVGTPNSKTRIPSHVPHPRRRQEMRQVLEFLTTPHNTWYIHHQGSPAGLHLQPLTHVVSANYFPSEGSVSIRPSGLILQLGKNARVCTNHVAGERGLQRI